MNVQLVGENRSSLKLKLAWPNPEALKTSESGLKPTLAMKV